MKKEAEATILNLDPNLPLSLGRFLDEMACSEL